MKNAVLNDEVLYAKGETPAVCGCPDHAGAEEARFPGPCRTVKIYRPRS